MYKYIFKNYTNIFTEFLNGFNRNNAIEKSKPENIFEIYLKVLTVIWIIYVIFSKRLSNDFH